MSYLTILTLPITFQLDLKIKEMSEQSKLDNMEIQIQKERIQTLLNDVREKEGKLNLKEQELNKMKDELKEYKKSNFITEEEGKKLRDDLNVRQDKIKTVEEDYTKLKILPKATQDSLKFKNAQLSDFVVREFNQ